MTTRVIREYRRRLRSVELFPRAPASAALWITLASAVAQVQIRGHLARADIDEAIQAGVAGTIAPFAMYPGRGDIARRALASNVPAPALVYTPFVRVALQAKAAHDRGETISPRDIAPAAIEPVVYIAFSWGACCGEVAQRLEHGKLGILAVFDPSAIRNAKTSARAMGDPRAMPLWIEPGTGPLRAIGIDPPEHIEAIAAFSLDTVAAAKEFRLERTAPDHRSAVIGFVAPIPEDTRRWR